MTAYTDETCTGLVDSHCHLDVAEFAEDLDAVIERARRVGVNEFVVPAIDGHGFARLRGLAERIPGFHAAYGLHPLYLERHQATDLQALRAELDTGGAVAVGEIGLDYADPDLDRSHQQRLFEAQLQLARDYSLPVIIHARRAVEQVILTLKRFPGLRGVIHSYAGSLEQARILAEMGFYLGFGGPLTYPGAHRLRKLVAALPTEQILIETDSPDQPLHGRQGQRNEPARLPAVLGAIAEIRQQSPAALALQTCANAERLFAAGRDRAAPGADRALPSVAP